MLNSSSLLRRTLACRESMAPERKHILCPVDAPSTDDDGVGVRHEDEIPGQAGALYQDLRRRLLIWRVTNRPMSAFANCGVPESAAGVCAGGRGGGRQPPARARPRECLFVSGAQ